MNACFCEGYRLAGSYFPWLNPNTDSLNYWWSNVEVNGKTPEQQFEDVVGLYSQQGSGITISPGISPFEIIQTIDGTLLLAIKKFTVRAGKDGCADLPMTYPNYASYSLLQDFCLTFRVSTCGPVGRWLVSENN